MKKFQILKTNGDKVSQSFNDNLSLEDLQKIVGGYIEFLPLKDNKFMIVNEDGKCINLPINIQATFIAKNSNINDFIVGDVVVIDRKFIN